MTWFPTQAGTGNKYQVEVDYTGNGAAPVEFRRFYNSQGRGNPSLGPRWRHTYDRQIVVMESLSGGAPAVMVKRQTGRGVVFTYWNGAWRSSKDVSDRLTTLVDGSGNPVGWEYYVSATEETETYAVSGKLVAIANRGGLTRTLVYSDASTPSSVAPRPGFLIQVSDPFGRHLDLTWSSQERLATVTDPDGQVYRYSYDTNGNLSQVKYPDATPADPNDNPKRTYHYENASCKSSLTGITDETNTRFATYTYDNQCRVSATEHAGGANRVTFTYGTGTTTITDARSTARTLTFQVIHGVTHTTALTQPCAVCGGLPAASISHDANGNVASRIDFNGNRVNYTYDLSRNLETQRIEGLTSTGSATAATGYISTEWHATFRLPLRIAEATRITTFTYDSNGTLTSKSVQATTDANGSLGFSATPTGSPRAWTYTPTYHGTISGFITQMVVDGPRSDVSDVTTYVYDSASGSLTSVTNALGHVTSFSNYDAHGRPLQVTDPNGLVTTLAYDLRGRLTSRSAGGEVTSYDYDGAGQLKKVTMPDGSYLSYTYDGAHRLTQIQDNLGNKIVYTLDLMGNRTKEEVLDPASTLARKREREYNALNRLIKDIGGANPVTEITQYAYDTQGNLTTVTDPFGKVTTNEYDPLNRLKKLIDPAATGSGQGGNTQYAYDGLDQLTQVTDPRNLATTYTLDGLGNLTQQVSPDSGTGTSSYDAAGNPTSQTDARGVVATFAYDALNRLTQAVYTPPGGSGITPVTLTYSYDQGTDGKGHLTGFTDPSGATSYAWNQKGRLTAEVRTIASVQYTTGYSYDGYGRLNRITYPSGRTVDYGFDALGRILQIDTTASSITQPVVSGVTYKSFGGVSGFTFGNATTYSRSYDLDGRVNGQSLGNLSRTVAYDAASRITGFTHGNPVYDQTFGHDNLARLTSWTSNTTSRAFGYDAVHNRTSETIGANNYTYGYPGTSNRLASATGPIAKSYTYDASGSPTTDGTHTFSYDGRGRLTHGTWGSVSADYQLNAIGQRVSKAPSNAPTTVFHFDQDGHLIAESNTAGQVQREYIYLNGMPVAVALGAAQTDLYFLHADHLDTPRVATNSINTIVWRWDGADPFGSALPSEDPDGNGQSFTLNLRFPGQYFDQETQLHYNYYRDYDPQTGRYLQSDPIGLEGGINTYAYAGQDPLRNIDPDGRWFFLVIPGLCAGGACELLFGGTALWCLLNSQHTADKAKGSSSPNTLEPGPHAGDSVPARGSGRNFDKGQRDAVNGIGDTSGCHTCGADEPGTKSGNWVPDHQPPSSLNPEGNPQQLYPQCINCSRVQGGQARGAKGKAGGTSGQ